MRKDIKMIDETFGEVEYCEDLGFIAHKDIEFGGSKSTIEITISCDEEEDGIEQFQRDAFVALFEDWECKIACRVKTSMRKLVGVFFICTP